MISCLNGVRAIAILLVIYSHISGPEYGTVGAYGVSMFFAHSGYVVAASLERNRGGSLWHVYLQRFGRILPALLVFCLVGLWVIPDWSGAIFPIMTYQYLIPGQPTPALHLWSLCVEAHFYVGLCLLWWLPKRCYIGLALAVGALCAFLALKVPYDCWQESATRISDVPAINDVHEWAYKSTVTNLPVLLAGTLIYYLRDAIRGREIHLAALVMVWSVLFHVLIQHHTRGGWVYFSQSVNVYERGAVGVACVLIALYQEEHAGWATLKNVLQSPVMAYIARISYGLYLYHFPIILWFRPDWMTVLLVTWGVSHASYYWVEAPVIDGIKWFTANKKPAPVAI